MKIFKDTVPEDNNLALPLEIDGGHWEGTVRRFLWALSLFVIVLVVISIFAPVREVALAEGEIIPVGSVVPVEHFEGGIVDTVYVGTGGLVKKGDLLLKLRLESGGGDFNQMRVRRDLLALRRLRLAAHLAGEEPDFGKLAKDYPRDANEQKLLFKTEKKTLESAGQVLKSRLAQRRGDVLAREQELEVVGAQLEIYQEQLEGQRKLIAKGFSSRARLLAAKARVEEVRVTTTQLKGAIEAGKGSIFEIESEIQQSKDAKRQEWSDLLVSTISEISELEERLTTAEDRVSRLAVHAPKSGIIQSLSVTLPGQVIRPGDVVAEIVPVNSSIEAEVRILPKDIGYVKVGHPAEIILTTFDPEVFGKVTGSVRSLSPTTFETERGDKYFKGLVTLDRDSLENNGRNFPITAGMVVSASVITGTKSIMQYIMKPVVRSYGRAFSER